MKTYSVKMFFIGEMKEEFFYSELVKLISETSFNLEESFGFKNLIRFSDYCTGTLLIRTPTNIPQLDITTGEFIDQTIYIFNEIDFLISKKYCLLIVFGSNTDSKEIIQTLSYRLGFIFTATLLNFLPKNVIKKIYENGNLLEIERMTIQNFQYKEGIIGKYSLKAEKNLDVIDLLNIYKDDVISARFSIRTDQFEQINLALSSNGSISIRCDSNEVINIIFEIFEKLLKKGGN
jgi:hypothetical protein